MLKLLQEFIFQTGFAVRTKSSCRPRQPWHGVTYLVCTIYMITGRDVPSCLIDAASLYVVWRLCVSVCTDEEEGEWDRGGMDEWTIKTPIPKCRLCWSFCLGWWSNIVGSKSGQKQTEKLLQNMVSSTTQHPPPPSPHSDTRLYCTFRLGKGGVGRGRSERR